MRTKFSLRFASILLAVSMLAGCSTFDMFNGAAKVDPTIPAELLYNEGLGYSNQKQYNLAAKKFEELNKQHPYSEYARKATVMQAFTNHSAGNYDEAALAAQRYLSLYPGAEDSAYMHFLLADSYYRRIPTVERDQGATEKALAAMEEMIQRYPKSQYVAEMKTKIEFAKDQLAGKEMEVGRYYLGKRDYLAALNRFKVVITKFQTTRHVEEALYRVAETNMAMGLSNEAQSATAILGHNFPKSPWYKDAFTLLKNDGLSPQEDKGSWISRALAGKF